MSCNHQSGPPQIGFIDMKKYVYNTQGSLVEHSISTQYKNDFAEQCKYGKEVHDRTKFVCPSQCDNTLSLGYVQEKLIGRPG
jgi:hypothetical protein